MKHTVFVTRTIPEAGLSLLRNAADVTVFEHERQIGKDELIQRIPDYNGLLCLLTDPVDADVIAAGSKLKCISTYAVGYNNINIEAAEAKGIAVTNTPGVLTEATADIAFALMTSCARRIVESDRWLREGNFTGWEPMLLLGHDLSGRTLGIIGAGRIGVALARKAIGAFHMRVFYYSRSHKTAFENKFAARYTDLDTLLAESDVVSVHVPLTPETYHLISEREFSLMKATAILVNTARGPVVDESAMIAALQEGRIYAAGLDVYENEPAVPEELLRLPNTVLLPHIGSASTDTRERMAVMAAQNLIDELEGRQAANRVC